ncbi:MAG: hypothetical protein R6V49_11540 [Bacteroidales bacterium]
MKRIVLVSFILPLLFQAVDAQPNLKDSAASVWFLQPHISLQAPQGDMKERFYPNTAVGFGLFRKTDANWLFGIEMSYLFAEKVKNEDKLLSNIITSEGYVIDQTGVFANIHFRERGFYAQVKTGKIIPTRFGNPNSGLLIMGSLGLLQHKIRIEVYENTAPQLADDYKKGYDKLTGGPAGSLYVGYMHFSNNKLTNYSIGAEYIYGATKSLRDYDFVLMGRDETLRGDQLLSLRFTWIIPFYQRLPKDYYFN